MESFFFFFPAKHVPKPFTNLDEHEGIGVFLHTVYDRLDLPNLSPFTCFGVNFSFYFFAKFLKFEPLPERTGRKNEAIPRRTRNKLEIIAVYIE